MRVFLVLLTSVIIISPARGQGDLRFSGYFVNFPLTQHLQPTISTLFNVPQNQFIEVSRLRLRPSLSFWEDAFLMLEYEVNATYSSGSFLLQAEPTDSRQIVDLTWNAVQGAHWTVVHFVDRLYFRQITDVADLTIGRQRISWGTGRVWNPTDLFNPLNPTSYSKFEKDGVDAIMTKIILGNFTDISLVYNPKRSFKENNLGFRFRTNYEGFDFSFVGGVFDKRIVTGADFAGSVFDAGIRGEGIYSTSSDQPSTNFVSFILGMDNQFSEKLYALAEYHFNGRGKNSTGLYQIQDLFQGTILNLGRHFVVLQASYLFHPLVTGLVSVTRSFTDESGFFAAAVTYSSSNETSISLGGQYFYGSPLTEFWYYPNSAYLKFDYFF